MDGPALIYEHFQIETDSSGAPVVLESSGQVKTFRALDTRLRQPVALKVVARALLTDENIRKRFLNEARAAAALSHPNIARVLHLCPPDSPDFYYAMELVEGESLAQRIAEKGRLPVAQALATLRPITAVLDLLGHQRFVHRDIQPANIILTTDATGGATVKLINFGLAKFLGPPPDLLEAVRTADLRGTTVFNLSPEQIQGESVDTRADFYALGVTLWMAIVGQPPFVGSPYEINEGHLHGDLPWAALPPTTGPVRSLIETLLAKSPQDRPADAEALGALWDEAMRSLESIPASPQGDDTPASTIIDPPAPGEAPQIIPLATPPPGCARLPESGFLAENQRNGDIVFVRPLPSPDPHSIRGELLEAANLSRNNPSGALLNVREIDDLRIVSEWHPGIPVADLLASRPTALPSKITGPWLRTAAQAVDWAREHGIGRANFSLGNWLVTFLDLQESESSLERAARDPESWGPTTIALDPLAAFDPILVRAAADSDQPLPAGRLATFNTPASYLTAFARSVERLLEPDRAEPLGAPARSLLTDAVAGQSKFSTAREWVAALLGDEVVGTKTTPPAPPVATPKVRINLPDVSPTVLSASATSAVRPPRNGRNPRLSSLALRGVIGSVALVLASWAFVALRPGPPPVALSPTPDPGGEVRRLVDLARGNLEQAQYSAAGNQLAQARAAAGDGVNRESLVAEIDTLSVRLKAAERPAPAAAIPPPATDAAAAITQATRDEPFENKLGMQFVPVPIAGGETGGLRVLFAVNETRVREFEKFIGRRWRDADATEEYPAVAIIPEDVASFCRWLSQQASLPPGWFYRLPTDHEWSCAAGIGREENPAESALSKGRNLKGRYAWGTAWPPPAGAGNFADLSLQRSTGADGIKGYDDTFPILAPVRQFRPNAFALYDLAGNAAEWCSDGNGFILRGGAFNSLSRNQLDLAARATRSAANTRDGTAGFRLVISDRKVPR